MNNAKEKEKFISKFKEIIKGMTQIKSKEVFRIVREYAPTDYCQLSLDTGKLCAKSQLRHSQQELLKKLNEL